MHDEPTTSSSLSASRGRPRPLSDVEVSRKARRLWMLLDRTDPGDADGRRRFIGAVGRFLSTALVADYRSPSPAAEMFRDLIATSKALRLAAGSGYAGQLREVADMLDAFCKFVDAQYSANCPGETSDGLLAYVKGEHPEPA
jgi:hypothetical protein